ncbi:uncharacterized protein TNIN_175511 [Trichonephila inaurata madagascariensis]|uniref:Uncharacterized protein n=1 Tax=Trichonephila inaurata madagascariensis TaxID=2747483 RepID=A0A8X7CHT1_9ARAC|nr:uncharacterized protein TNIN_175511 [Trichonephila inaurata madagascariensis]
MKTGGDHSHSAWTSHIGDFLFRVYEYIRPSCILGTIISLTAVLPISIMIAKIALLLVAFVAAEATILAPGLLNAGILAPGAITTGSVVAIPGAVSTDSRIIGTPGLIAGSPLLLNSGLIGLPHPAPLWVEGALFLGAPGVVKTILK